MELTLGGVIVKVVALAAVVLPEFQTTFLALIRYLLVMRFVIRHEELVYLLYVVAREALDLLNSESINFMSFFGISFHFIFDFIVAESARVEFHTLITLFCTSLFIMRTP